MGKQIKILLFTNAVLQKENNTGNTWQNLFHGIPNVEITNVYCRAGIPTATICDTYFQISEKQLLKNLLNKRIPSGHVVELESDSATVDTLTSKQNVLYNFARKRRFILFFWLRELIWIIGRWQSQALKDFLDNHSPDLIVSAISDYSYYNRVLLFLADYTNIPIVSFIGDDIYTLRQFSFSPLFWIDRLINRYWIKKIIDKSSRIYVASDIQKTEFDKIFHRDCQILYKGADFNNTPSIQEVTKPVIQLVYTGVLGMKRYESLGQIGKALDELNNPKRMAELHIYSQTPLSNRMKKLFASCDSIIFHGQITFDEVLQQQQVADILVHVESLDVQQRLIVRHSFSTKLVDYFNAAKCIFACGWQQAASIDYLIQNDAAIVAVNKQDIKQNLKMLINDRRLITDYAWKAWECGKRNHRIEHIQKSLYSDLVTLMEK